MRWLDLRNAENAVNRGILSTIKFIGDGLVSWLSLSFVSWVLYPLCELLLIRLSVHVGTDVCTVLY